MPSDSYAFRNPNGVMPQGDVRQPRANNRSFVDDATNVLAPTTGTGLEAISRFLPIASDAWAVDDIKNEANAGNYKTAGALGLLSLAGMGGALGALSKARGVNIGKVSDLAKKFPKQQGIFVGPRGAKGIAKELGNDALIKSQDMAFDLMNRGLPDSEIWYKTREATGYPTMTKMLGGQMQTEIKDTPSMFAPRNLSRLPTEKGDVFYTQLENVLNHKELLAAYPELKSDIFKVKQLPDSLFGYRQQPKRPGMFGVIGMNAKIADEGNIDGAQTIIHELQHAADHYEGLPPGASVEMMQSILGDSPEQLAIAHELATAKRLSDLNKKDIRWVLEKRRENGVHIPGSEMLTGGLQNDYANFMNDMIKQYGADEWINNIRRDPEERVRVAGHMNPNAAYQRTSGEVKARLAEKRMVAPRVQHDYPTFKDERRTDWPTVDEIANMEDTPLQFQIRRDPESFARIPHKNEAPVITIPTDSPMTERNGKLVHVTDLPEWDDEHMDSETLKNIGIKDFKDGGLVDALVSQLSKDEIEQLLVDLHPNAPERYAVGGLVSDSSLIDPKNGIFANQMELVNPTSKGKAPLDIPLNENNMLAHNRMGTAQAQLYRTR